MKKIFIVGSCVTRDAFDTRFTKDTYTISRYLARTSLARLNYKPLNISEGEVDLKSNFQRRVVTKALNGLILDDIKSIDFDYLVLDLVDDRFGLVKVNGEDAFSIFSDELKSSKFISVKEKVKIAPNSQEYRKAWEAGLVDLLKVVSCEKIVVNNVQWSTQTDAGTELSNPDRIAFCTDVVNGLYAIAEKYIPKENFINYPGDIFVGAENHKWGRSPFHYVDNVYRYFIERLDKITS